MILYEIIVRIMGQQATLVIFKIIGHCGFASTKQRIRAFKEIKEFEYIYGDFYFLIFLQTKLVIFRAAPERLSAHPFNSFIF